MPVHDWTRVEAGIFHSFRNVWMAERKMRSMAASFQTTIMLWWNSTRAGKVRSCAQTLPDIQINLSRRYAESKRLSVSRS